MRLRASFTVENSVIIPLFTIIIVTLVITGLDMHDELVLKAACFQGGMKLEQEEVDASQKSAYLSEIVSYVQSKCMRKTYSVSDVTEKIDSINVKDNSPREFIRKRCALNAL